MLPINLDETKIYWRDPIFNYLSESFFTVVHHTTFFGILKIKSLLYTVTT